MTANPTYAQFMAIQKGKRGKIAALLNEEGNPIAPYNGGLKKLYDKIMEDYKTPLASALASLPMQMRRFARKLESDELMKETIDGGKGIFNPNVLAKMVAANFFQNPKSAAYDLRSAGNILPGTQAGYNMWQQHPHLFDYPDIDSGNVGGAFQSLVYSYLEWRSSSPVILAQLKADYPGMKFPKTLSRAKAGLEISRVLHDMTTTSYGNFMAWLGNESRADSRLSNEAFNELVYGLRPDQYQHKGITADAFARRNRKLPANAKISATDAETILKQLAAAGNAESGDRGNPPNFLT